MIDPGARGGVAVCIATHRRPDGLTRLLRALDEQTGIRPGSFRVVVVDNDPERSATPVLDWASTHTGLDLHVGVETRHGVSHVRNRSIELAGDVALVAVVDDDACPAPGWLAELILAVERTGADAVGGRVVYEAEDPDRRWLTALALFNSSTRGIDDAPTHTIGVGNSIVRRAVLPDPPFDPSWGPIGGEDTELFFSLHRAGRRLVTTERAITNETIEPERLRPGWLFRRAFRLGSTWTMIERRVAGTSPIVRVGRAAVRIGRGAGSAVTGALRLDRLRTFDGLLDATEGVGMLAGVARITVTEYGPGGRRLVRVAAVPPRAQAVSRAEPDPTD